MADELREGIAKLVAMGPIPTTDQADGDPASADQWEALLGDVVREGAVTGAEAAALAQLFPADGSDGYGVAWTLVHVIESASGWPANGALEDLDGPWAAVLRQRALGG